MISKYIITSSVNNDHLSIFPFSILFTFYFFLLHLLEPPIKWIEAMLFCSWLREMLASNILLLKMKFVASVCLYQVDKFSSLCQEIYFLIMTMYWILSKTLLLSIEMIVWFSFNLSNCRNRFYNVKPSVHSRDKSDLVMIYFFFGFIKLILHMTLLFRGFKNDLCSRWNWNKEINFSLLHDPFWLHYKAILVS